MKQDILHADGDWLVYGYVNWWERPAWWLRKTWVTPWLEGHRYHVKWWKGQWWYVKMELSPSLREPRPWKTDEEVKEILDMLRGTKL